MKLHGMFGSEAIQAEGWALGPWHLIREPSQRACAFDVDGTERHGGAYNRVRTAVLVTRTITIYHVSLFTFVVCCLL